jgi:putative glutamine amidotransferase
MSAKHDRPLVGISANIESRGASAQDINETYLSAIYHAGGSPLVIPIPDIGLRGSYAELARGFVRRLDGVLLSGGDDIDAHLYGEDNLEFNGSFTEERDLFEIELCGSAASLKKPILGICRGIQALNVAMGGTLIQDIARQRGDGKPLQHAQKAPSHSPVHAVELAPGSLVAGILLGPGSPDAGGTSVRVNSFHHQAIKDVAPDFVISAAAADGIVEAIEPQTPGAEAHPFTIGVQWHPERMWRHHEHARNLFVKFVEACADGMGRESGRA